MYFYHKQIKKREKPSAETIGFGDKPVNKSLMQTKNNKGPRIEPRWSPGSATTHPEACPFRITL